jgi:hypothetical protein
LKLQNGANKDKLPPTLLYSSLYHIVLQPDEDSIREIISKKLEKEKFISPIKIDEEDGIKGIRSKITSLIIKSPFT